MKQLSKQAIDEFEERLQAERDYLISRETDSGFFERISIGFLPFLRSDTISAPIVAKWQEACMDMALIIRANEELNTAFLELWEHAKRTGNRVLKRQLVQVFRKVKGPSPHVEIGNWGLSRTITFALRHLFAEHIAKTNEFSFAPTAIAIEKRQSEFHTLADNDPSFLWGHMISLDNCRACKNISIFSMRWETLRGDKATMGTRAYEAQQKYLVAMTAEDLRFLDHSGYNPCYFVRETFARYIDRLSKALLFELRKTTPSTKQKNRTPQQQIDTRINDRAMGIEKMRGYVKNNHHAKLDEMAKWLDKEVKAHRVRISSPRAHSTYKSWAREAGLQQSDAKVRGKDKSPRKSHSR